MGWLVIDIYVMYLCKSAVRIFYFLKSLKWERRTALLKDWAILDPGWGCPSVRLQYEFTVNEHTTESYTEIPFQLRWHAKTYAESLALGLHPVIRVNPRNPAETRFFELDQPVRSSSI